MNQNLPIVAALKKPVNLALFVMAGSLFFAVNYYAMAKLPGSRDYMCVMGGNFTAGNIMFSIMLSLAAGLLAAGMWEQVQQKRIEKSYRMGSASTVGIVMGTITSFCTVCTLPVISLFGIGGALTFISEYQLHFKALSLLFLVAGLYLLNKQLKKECKLFCKTDQ